MDILPIEGLLKLPSPLQKIEFKAEFLANYDIYIKRDECIHPLICGNKWRKLKYQLLSVDSDISQIVSIGGPYSNHLVALASACNVLKVKSVGIVRSFKHNVNTHSINLMRKLGMNIVPLHPEEYERAKRDQSKVLKHLTNQDSLHFIEEGGTSPLAMRGIADMLKECDSQSHIPFDYLFTAVGTGTTLAGLAMNFKGEAIYGIAPFKEPITQLSGLDLIKDASTQVRLINCRLNLRFGKRDQRIEDFIKSFSLEYNIRLDSVYTARAMMNMIQLLQENVIPKGAKLLFYHTGGLQGDQIA